MTKRTFILLFIFLFLVIFGGTFIAVWKLYWNEEIRNYVVNLATCSLLSESVCLENPKCEPIYRQNSSIGNTVEFEECKLIPDYKKKSLATDEQLCNKTGGQWQRLKSGYYCNCVSLERRLVWIKGQGCQPMPTD